MIAESVLLLRHCQVKINTTSTGFRAESFLLEAAVGGI
jgi:hypothetical protein